MIEHDRHRSSKQSTASILHRHGLSRISRHPNPPLHHHNPLQAQNLRQNPESGQTSEQIETKEYIKESEALPHQTNQPIRGPSDSWWADGMPAAATLETDYHVVVYVTGGGAGRRRIMVVIRVVSSWKDSVWGRWSGFFGSISFLPFYCPL
jgi:hypothetical protein